MNFLHNGRRIMRLEAQTCRITRILSAPATVVRFNNLVYASRSSSRGIGCLILTGFDFDLCGYEKALNFAQVK